MLFFGAAEEVDRVKLYAQYNMDKNMRGAKYCEVLASNNRLGLRYLLQLSAYNTMMFGCDEEKWKQVTEKKMAKQFDALMIKLNGPRFWMMVSLEHGFIAVHLCAFDLKL